MRDRSELFDSTLPRRLGIVKATSHVSASVGCHMEYSAILRGLSIERISTYRQHAPEGSDRDRAALDLYERNLLLSGILDQGLAIVEVVARNAIHEAPSQATFGSESAPWWENTEYQAWLDPRAREKLESVPKRSKSFSLPVDQVVQGSNPAFNQVRRVPATTGERF